MKVNAPLRVLILVDCYYPGTKSSAKLVHDLAVELYRRGNQAIVLTPSELVSEQIEIRTEDGVSVVRVKAGRLKGANRIQRAANEARLSTSLWRKAGTFLRQNPCDLILFYSPTIFFGDLVRRLKQTWSCPAYLILRDIFPDWAVDTGVLRKGLVYRFLRRVATKQYRVADVIAVQSPANLRYFAHAFPQEQFRLKVLFNWTSLQEALHPRTSYRARLGLEGKIVFLFGGNIGIAQDMDNIARLAARLAFRPDIHFLVVGDGSEVARLKKSIEASRLSNIQVLPCVSQRDYLSMVSEFDSGLISLHARLKSHNVPGKLLSYLYGGLPVLASVNPGNDLFALLQDSGAGFCLLNGDDESLALAALQLADDAALRSAMRGNVRRLLEETFSVEYAVDQIIAHLHEAGLIVSANGPSLVGATDPQVRPAELAEQF
jgi:O26-antigen biosynthesis N-acetyl-L-fucosamine transferase